jgi:hypothetical protein
LVWFLGALWATGACGSRAGVPRAAAVFPRLTLALEFADLGAVYSADAEESERGSPSVKWVSGSGAHGSFCLALWGPLAPVVPVLGYHRRPLCFHGLILGFVLPLILGIALVHSGYGWRVWQVAPVFLLHGGLLICSESSFSATYSSGRGDPSDELSPIREGIPQRHGLIRLKTMATTATSPGPKAGHLLIGAVQEQAPFGCFVLHLGVFRASFGLLSRERFSSGTPLDSLWPLLGAWVPLAPVWGP